MVQPEKRLLWHPRHDNKFVVGGNTQITLYEWAPDYPEIRHVTSQHDLQYMKCFAWSPDPSFDDLIAVGLSTGRVDLIRLEASKHARRHNMLSSGPSISLPVRTSRSCNALAFCTADPNYLAVGLDKVRNDCSLVIWDIASCASALTLPPINVSSASSTTVLPLPSRPQPQIPRTENNSRIDTRILQQHASTEIVSSLAFLPASTHLLLAGISLRWLRLFDLRAPTATLTNVASKVQGMATDPFDAHRIACFGDGMVTVWDARRMVQPVLMFSERDASADGARLRQGSVYANVEFSSTRRGCLATLEKDANYVRFWDVSEAKAYVVDGALGGAASSSDGGNGSSRDSSRATRRSWAANLPWPTGGQQSQQSSPVLREPSFSEAQSSFFLSDTRRTKTFPRSLASFALVPNTSSHSLTTNVMLVNKDGDLQMYAIHDTPKQATWSARGDLAIGAGVALTLVEGYKESALGENEPPAEGVRRSTSGYKYTGSLSRRGSRSRSTPATDDFLNRGRSGKSTPVIPPSAGDSPAVPTFGRGDDDGFPALGDGGSVLVVPTGLSATRPGKTRTYSPASLRKYKSSADRPDTGAGANGSRSGRRRSRSKMGSVQPAVEEERHTRLPSRSRSRGSLTRVPRRQRTRDSKGRGVSHVVEDDISMIMRRRALAGYGLSKPDHNAIVTQDDHDPSDGTTQMLSELWAWLFHSQELLCIPTPRLHAYDFSHQGLMGIWEGLAPVHPPMHEETIDDTPIPGLRSLLLDTPSTATGPTSHRGGFASPPNVGSNRRSHSPADDLHGDWEAALLVLTTRQYGAARTAWKPAVMTNKPLQRQVALQLCGWSLREEQLNADIRRWEKEGNFSRAACWLVFTRQYSKAVELLMRSDDEAHRMMSGTIAALAPHGSMSPRSIELREHCERLVVRLQDPYFRAMLTHLALGDWAEVLEEEILPFHERLTIAFQFLDDKALSSYLRRATERAVVRGDIDSLIVTGITKTGLDTLQSYVDRTGDVQTAAILSSYVCPHKFQDKRAEKWLETYRDLLDGFKLYHHRVGFDIERGQLLSEAMQNGDMALEELVPRQILIRCHYCNKAITNQRVLLASQQNKGRPTACPNCNRALPRCSVCLMTLSIVQDAARDVELGYSQYKDTIDDAIVICQTCRHGGHAAHILEWFLGEDGARAHGVCPVADCNCHCADEF